MRLPRFVLCAVLLSLAPVAAQSPLGEVSRQEEERRKTLQGESRVYTNRDLPKVASPVRPPQADAAASPTAPDAAVADEEVERGADEVSDGPRDRAYWSGRLSSLRETLARNQTYAEALQSRINALTTDFVNRDDPLQRAAVAADRDRAVTELERLRKQIVADDEAIADLQDEARRAGVPAGWLR